MLFRYLDIMNIPQSLEKQGPASCISDLAEDYRILASPLTHGTGLKVLGDSEEIQRLVS